MKLPFQLFELPFFIQFLYNVGLQFSENQTKFLEKGSCGLADQYRLWRQYIVCIGVQRFQKKRQTFFVRVNSGFCINIFLCNVRKTHPPTSWFQNVYFGDILLLFWFIFQVLWTFLFPCTRCCMMIRHGSPSVEIPRWLKMRFYSLYSV